MQDWPDRDPIKAEDDLRALLAARLDPWQGPGALAPPQSDQTLNPDIAVSTTGLRAAAVLIALIEYPQGIRVLFTRRADTLRKHTGQIAFPGGGIDEGETVWQAALREAHEEVGLEPGRVELAGLSTPFMTRTGYHVTPVVGFVKPGFVLTPNPHEVAETFETPFDHLMDSANHAREWFEPPDHPHRWIYAIEHDGRRIWGLTASIIRGLHDRLYGVEDV